MKLFIIVLRVAFAGWFAFWGLAPLFGVSVPPTEEPAAFALLEANRGTFSMQLAQASFVAGGLLLLIPRTAPLGLAVLAPTVAWIFLFHMTMTGDYAWGGFWLGAFLVLAWWYRDAFRSLVGLDRKAA